MAEYPNLFFLHDMDSVESWKMVRTRGTHSDGSKLSEFEVDCLKLEGYFPLGVLFGNLLFEVFWNNTDWDCQTIKLQPAVDRVRGTSGMPGRYQKCLEGQTCKLNSEEWMLENYDPESERRVWQCKGGDIVFYLDDKGSEEYIQCRWLVWLREGHALASLQEMRKKYG